MRTRASAVLVALALTITVFVHAGGDAAADHAGTPPAEPFPCGPGFYLAHHEPALSGPTGLLAFDAVGLAFTAVGAGNAPAINAIGFNSADGYLYGMEPSTGEVFLIDSAGVAHPLGTPSLPGPPGGRWVAGTFVDGDTYLVGQNHPGGWLAVIDVDPNSLMTLQTRRLPAGVQVADFAVHPSSGKLYGHDGGSGDIVEIDYLASPVVVRTVVPATGIGTVGAAMFTAAGTLLLHGTSGGVAQDTLYAADVDAGTVVSLGLGPSFRATDGASCATGVALEKTVFPNPALPGMGVKYTYTITNRSDQPASMDLRDVMTDGRTFAARSLVSGCGGTPNSYANTGVLEVQGVVVPAGGVCVVRVRVRIPPWWSARTVFNQAQVDVAVSGSVVTVPSDDPATPDPWDRTLLEVVAAVDSDGDGITDRDEELKQEVLDMLDGLRGSATGGALKHLERAIGFIEDSLAVGLPTEEFLQLEARAIHALERVQMHHAGVDDAIELLYCVDLGVESRFRWMVVDPPPGPPEPPTGRGPIKRSKAVRKLADSYRDLMALQVELDQVIGTATDVFPRDGVVERTGEAAIGNLVADALRTRYGTDLALTNGGGIRTPLPSQYLPADRGLRRDTPGYSPGPPYDLVVGDVRHMLRFGNAVVTRTITGEGLWSLLEHGVRDVPAPAGAFPQISGFSFEFDSSRIGGNRVVSVTLDGGAPVFPNNTEYTIAVNDFINMGGDGYPLDGSGEVREPMVDVVAEHIAANSPVSPDLEGRIVDVAP